MGIGNLYATVLDNLGHGVVTVDSDPTKGADFETVDAAIIKCGMFDTAHICTPNFTHFELAAKLAPASRIVFVEKPGVADSFSWRQLVEQFKYTRFMMVKNNMWRDNIKELQSHVTNARTVKIKWINKNRIPNPGTWFTTKKLAYGGVSRDLMPHLLSLYIALNPNYISATMTGQEKRQQHTLDTIQDTEYGVVKRDGVYDVDDLCKIKYMQSGRTWKMEANWADGKEDHRAITFEMDNGTDIIFELGLCPEEAYQAMIKEAVEQVDNPEFWIKQIEQDIWIHDRITSI
jgi:predicted dehydrogenase